MIRFMIGFMSLILTVGIVEGAESFTIAAILPDTSLCTPPSFSQLLQTVIGSSVNFWISSHNPLHKSHLYS